MNTNTKESNQNRVRAVSAFLIKTECVAIKKNKNMVCTDDMLTAYYDCRKNKRGTASAIAYEVNYESRLIDLRDRINARTYVPGKSICFVVKRPRYREVFAASFEDRIVHHYIAIRLEPLFEEIFSDRTFNCRKGKGQLYGVKTLKGDIVMCSEYYTKDCYIMKLDLKGFFMSIDKIMMSNLIDSFILKYYKGDDIEDLRFLCNTVILHCPEKNCERHSPIEYWLRLPPEKSLFTNGDGKGIAIGNLFAQLFANFLLDILDWHIEEIGSIYHGRYVDDFYIIHEEKEKLLKAIPKIRSKLSELGLRLNEKKFYLQHYAKGVEFTGAIVKPYRVYVCNRTVNNLIGSVRKLNRARNFNEADRAIRSINSYLGLMRHYNTYAIRRSILSKIENNAFEYMYIRGGHLSIAVKTKYKKKDIKLTDIGDNIYE